MQAIVTTSIDETDTSSSLIDPEFSPSEFVLWQESLRRHCGIFITESRRHLLRHRLVLRMRSNGMTSLTEYYNFLHFNGSSADEWAELRSRLLNHESSFFRHQPSLDELANFALRELAESKRAIGDYTLRLWSAGCAGGHEPYTLAMQLAERGYLNAGNVPFLELRTVDALPDENWDVAITASDIDAGMLQRTLQGSYHEHELRGLSALMRIKYFQAENDSDRYRVNTELRRTIVTQHADLSDPGSLDVCRQDVIFCQNVLIYFHPEDRIAVVQGLMNCLQPGGFLFLGPGEFAGQSVDGLTQISREDCVIYQRDPMRHSHQPIKQQSFDF